ncbi:hypothetical protein BpHYR1_037474 [Brachionus plicatilis]|uniref:Uncharacterized protein n=1 Tax=Brachionus plicatilis TaxID=10195 RepID=A0A3M7RCZ7_BRAPC|nr:hypothetical protein BpHYR1_037474 [Brachionus plicatilis]
MYQLLQFTEHTEQHRGYSIKLIIYTTFITQSKQVSLFYDGNWLKPDLFSIVASNFLAVNLDLSGLLM